MSNLKEPKRGDPITADWARELVRELRAQRLSAGPGLKLTRTPSGTTVSVARKGNEGDAEVETEDVDVMTLTATASGGVLSDGTHGTVAAVEFALQDTLPSGTKILVHKILVEVQDGE